MLLLISHPFTILLRSNCQAMLDDGGNDTTRYNKAQVPPSALPPRNFCVVSYYWLVTIG